MQATGLKRTWAIALAGVAWFSFALGLYAFSYPESPTLLPLLPMAVLGVLLALWDFQGFQILMVGMVPLSIGFSDVGGGLGVAIPGEPMLLIAAGAMFLLVLRGDIPVRPLLAHPIGLAIGLHLIWAVVSLAASSYTEISSKFLVARCTYILVYYFGFGELFRRDSRTILQFVKAHAWGFVPVIIYAVVKLSSYGLSRNTSPVMADPFYDDHTVFGACLAVILPLVVWIARRDKMQLGRWNLAWGVAACILVAILLSFSRAAWMGLGVMGGIWAMLRLRVKFVHFLLLLALAGGGAWLGRDAIVERFEQNDNISGEDVFSTAASVTNVNTDDSNRERINRWACALRMWDERPWLGFGPGTYERNYGDFQVLAELTRISSWVGDRGDAHSEYLGALAEQGVPGLICLVTLFLTSIAVAMRVAVRGAEPWHRTFATAILMGLGSYYFHGFVNDFIDIDKMAALFWGLLAMLAVMDLQISAPNPANQPIKAEKSV